MNIDDLLNRYFEGETTSEEERRIRAFFSTGPVPEHLVVYKPLFAYFDEEIRQEAGPVKKYSLSRRKLVYVFSGVAAIFLVLLGIGHLLLSPAPVLCSGNYVVINGRCYTDIHTVRTFAAEALQEVATPAGDYFPVPESNTEERDILDNQLKELGSLFSEDK